jgi:hypothetical protein
VGEAEQFTIILNVRQRDFFFLAMKDTKCIKLFVSPHCLTHNMVKFSLN